MRIFIILAPAGGRDAAGIISGHTRTKVTVYLWTICSGDNNKGKAKKTVNNQISISWEGNVKMVIAMSLMLKGAGVYGV